MRYRIILEDIHGCLVNQLDGSRCTSIDTFRSQIEPPIVQARNKGFIPFVVLTDIIEGRVYDNDANDRFDELRQLMTQLGVEYVFLCDSGFKEHSELINKGDLIYSNFLLLSSYVRTILDKDQEVNDVWNYTSLKGLWTPGKMDRPHRALLAKRLWEENLLDSIEYSCYLAVPDYLHATFFNEYDDERFERFNRETSKQLDLVGLSDISKLDMFNGYPYDVNIYRNTSFSIVTESDFLTRLGWSPKITEKTYRAIANNHPFIQVLYPGILDKLQSYGFSTFKDYMLIPDYNDLLTIDERIEASLKNMIHFQNILQDSHVVEKINNDVVHNRNMFENLAQKEIQILSFIFERNQDPDAKIDLMSMSQIVYPSSSRLFR